MGEQKRKQTRLEKFKVEKPACCICGGKKSTETIEHAPPKVIFWDKLRLQGMEVPACKRCNNGSRKEDQLAAFFAIMQSPAFQNGDTEDKMIRYFEKLSKGCMHNIENFNTFFSSNGVILLESNGTLEPQHKLTFKNEIFSKYLNRWAAKQAIAHWFYKNGSIFSENGVVLVRWITNFELMSDDKIPKYISLFDNLDELEQGSKKSGDQFFIKYPNTKTGDNIHLVFAAYHGTAFIAAMIDEFDWREKITTDLLGNHSAAFATNEADGIHQIHI